MYHYYFRQHRGSFLFSESDCTNNKFDKINFITAFSLLALVQILTIKLFPFLL